VPLGLLLNLVTFDSLHQSKLKSSFDFQAIQRIVLIVGVASISILTFLNIWSTILTFIWQLISTKACLIKQLARQVIEKRLNIT